MLWSDRGGVLTIKPDAFLPSREEGLSVFDAHIVSSRRYVLEDHINKQIAHLQDLTLSEDRRRRIETRVTSGALTVEKLYDEGWRVVELPMSAFPLDAFQLSSPDEDGHLNVLGAKQDFERMAPAWVQVARMLTRQECLERT